MIKTYLDSGVLIAADRGTDSASLRAISIYLNADEFITTEKSNKPLHRITEITLISIAN